MIAMADKTALVTGASSGFGLRISIALALRGYRVMAAMRDLGRGDELLREAERAGVASRLDPVRLDVTDAESIEAAMAHAARRYGRLDVLVNNAGFAVGGFAEEVPMDDWRAQMETNFFGVVAMCRAAIPLMRKQGGGTIIQLSSVSGRIAFPGYGAYAASKFAVEGFSESLRHELAPHGIRVVLVEPGAYRTAIWDKGFSGIRSRPDSPYRKMLEAVLEYSRRAAATSKDPREVAELVARLAESRAPRLRYAVGRGTKLTLFGKAALPWRWFEAIIQRTLSGKAGG